MRKLRLVAVLALAALLRSSTAGGGAVVIKIGSVAPSRSPWDTALQEVARDWEKISNGTVQVKIYPGGIAGGEMDMIRKMRLGVLQGGVFTNMGLNKIERSVLALNIPFLFDSQEEFEAVFEKMQAEFEAKLEAQGFKVILWTLAGWVHFFAKDKVVYPDDLRKHTVSVTADDPELEQIWKRMGFQVVPGDEAGLMVQLQSGMVTAAYLPPLIAGSGQYFAIIPHMLSLTLSPLLGGLVLSDRAWKSIPEEYRQPMLDAVVEASRGLYEKTMDLEREAIETMKEHGLIIHDPPPDAMEKWREGAAESVSNLVGRVVPKETYDQILSHIQEYRKGRGK
jgi:TRAP-type C4-dicarboxylate transport system substrate-binding protein